mmetsp:Transcript_22427/g.28300  ORF Transcript_22427/g.28300 Transcript_22427/m.28300 type:complete len:455 (-) Transcript_22427:139-1503(-)
MQQIQFQTKFLSVLILLSFVPNIICAVDYGVDVSFPMHRRAIMNNTENILPDRQAIYDEYIEGCRQKFSKQKFACDDSEQGRIDMSLSQPRSMQNYTEMGFKKIRTPPEVWELLLDFWKKNDPTDKIHQQKPENWAKGNSYANYWSSPTYMVSVEDVSLRGAGDRLKDAIWGAAKSTLEEWTGEELQPCSLYGIRIYTEGAILATHVDRLPLVSSAIVNVAQDVDEPWPIEVIGHDGRAHNVTMEPGDMVLYESHSVLHGRPFALKGRYFANIFIHFEPTGHTLRHTKKMELEEQNIHKKYKDSVNKGHGGHEADANHLPSYILEGSETAEEWLMRHGEEGEEIDDDEPEVTSGATEAHHAVQEGNIKQLSKIISEKAYLVHAKDENGWTPMHEAARTGSVDAVKLLVENGADVNALTEYGQSPLHLAKSEHGDDHPLVDFFTDIGALMEGPEL